jgi:predicted 3-demethylubiquinone-9 3-methyltransferase (glyoxalase superfamily)
MMKNMSKVRTCLWFDDTGADAAEFYTSLLPESSIDTPPRNADGSPSLVIEITLAGTPYMILNGGPKYQLSPAASIVVRTKDQEETDSLWSALLAGGGKESVCGWLTDRFGVSWQVFPEDLPGILSNPDRQAADRAMQAMLQMKKIDLSVLQNAIKGE